jgi:hypothetical protein
VEYWQLSPVSASPWASSTSQTQFDHRMDR